MPSYSQQWRMWILRWNRMSGNVVDSKLLTLGRTCSVGEFQHSTKNDFRQKGSRDGADWLWQYDAKIKSTFGFELCVWCLPQYLQVENVGVCCWWLFFKSPVYPRKKKKARWKFTDAFLSLHSTFRYITTLSWKCYFFSDLFLGGVFWVADEASASFA